MKGEDGTQCLIMTVIRRIIGIARARSSVACSHCFLIFSVFRIKLAEEEVLIDF